MSLTSLKDLFISISLPIIFEQLSQLQSTQYSPFAKQSQYNFKDFDFLQLHVNFFLFFLHSNFQYFCICYIKRIKVIYINIHIYVHVYFILIVTIYYIINGIYFFCFFDNEEDIILFNIIFSFLLFKFDEEYSFTWNFFI